MAHQEEDIYLEAKLARAEADAALKEADSADLRLRNAQTEVERFAKAYERENRERPAGLTSFRMAAREPEIRADLRKAKADAEAANTKAGAAAEHARIAEARITSTVTLSRSRWLKAKEHASDLAAELFQPGSGYGDPNARVADERRLQSAKNEEERLYRDYHDMSRATSKAASTDSTRTSTQRTDRNRNTQTPEPLEVFISYAREDSKIAETVFHRLREVGTAAWLDRRRILPGQDWRVAIKAAIRKCRIFLALMSTNSIDKRGYVQKELRLALNMLDEYPPESTYLIPVRLDNCRPSHDRVADLQWVDLFPDFEEGFALLCKAIGAVGSSTAPHSHKEINELSPTENAILREIRGKPDVDWTPATVERAIRRNRPELSGTIDSITAAVDRLTKAGYLHQIDTDRILLEEKAIDRYKNEHSYVEIEG